jgi:glycosyltransferase involved in cell wall biosynthesis
MPRPGSLVIASPGGELGRGGVVRYLGYILPHLRASGLTLPIKVIDTYGPGRAILVPVYFAVAFARIAALLAFGRISILHVNMTHFGSVVRKGLLLLLARKFSVPIVLHLHGSDYVEFCESLTPQLQRLHLRMLNSADRIITIGSYWRNYIVDRLGIDPRRVVVIHNCAPAIAVSSTMAQTALNEVSIVCLGQLSDRKGTGTLLRAMAMPSLRVLSWNAVLAGDGEVAKHRALAVKLGLSQRVRLPGWVDRERSHATLANADIFVLPSEREGMPIAILEAMAHGKAIVATDVGAIPEAIVHEQTGLIVRPNDPSGLARVLELLVRNSDLRRSLGQAARERHRQQFTIERVADDLTRLYQDIIDSFGQMPRNRPRGPTRIRVPFEDSNAKNRALSIR